MDDLNEPTARAAVFEGPGRLEPVSMPVPALRRGEVLVRVSCCTICGSDVHTWEGRRSAPAPSVLGHETVGIVDLLGPGEPARALDGRAVERGDRVTWSVAVHCGACFFCARGLPQKCESLFKYGHTALADGGAFSGGLAEVCVLRPNTSIARVPAAVPDRIAAPAGCATATVAAAVRAGGGAEGKVVLVQGAGALGLSACAYARQRDAAAVVVTDVNPSRLALARAFGADRAIDVSTGDAELRSAVGEITGGRGADLALEMSGAVAAIESGLTELRAGGDFVWVGSVFPTGAARIDPETVVRRVLRIHGVHNYAPEDLAAAVSFLADHGGRYPLADLVPSAFPLADAATAFETAVATRAPRVAVVPGME